MASLEDLKQKIETIKKELPDTLKLVATSVSMAGLGYAKRTISEKGFGAEYSETLLPTMFLSKNTLNKKGEKYTSSKKKGNWKEMREAQGLQTKFVDLAYSNEMWRGMNPQEPYVQGKYIIAPLGHNNQAGTQKMKWNYERYGNYIYKALGVEGFQLMGEVAQEEFSRILKEKYNL